MPSMSAPIITIDGPSGTGKGTISLMLASHLGWNYLDSGAIYRVLAYAANKAEVSSKAINRLTDLAIGLQLHFEIKNDEACLVYLDHKDITEAIRTEDCGQKASELASLAEVREALLERQRAFAESPGLVTDGRDMGTVVFPEAPLKIFLFASQQERAHRRFQQLKQRGSDVSLEQVIEELEKRDRRDTSRSHAPLKPAQDAIKIDTTSLSIVQVFDNVLQLAKERGI